jgi:hypothetical protein
MRLTFPMSESGGQLCARARFWASLRIDGELSELEGALLDAHVARCSDCAAFAAGVDGSTTALRAAPLVASVPVSVVLPASPRRVFAGVVAAAAVDSLALLGGLGDGPRSSQSGSVRAARVAVVATAETPDQLRRLRRTSLLNARPLPREVANEPA